MSRTSIKDFTREVHEDLENALVPRIKNLENIDEYVNLLQVFYGFYKPVEDAIDNTITADSLPDLSTRRKSSWITEDIVNMGHAPSSILCSNIPPIGNVPQALGAMYVLEGSTLGGKLISKMISQQLVNSSPSLRFFNGYGAATSSNWKSFIVHMEAALRSDDEWQQAAESATGVFVQFKKWVASSLYVAG